MKKDILSSIENIEIYPVISLLIFVIFFVGMFIWVVKADRQYINHMKDLPFDHESKNANGNEKI
ncbi:cbb3-type cytochrome c oxidase subunit 3 [Belliella kenyensis]|uniref:Cbb3-type cytochrome c oxidase subunit 3 n=1 Tax=Belliella kenyensis TaxID=1472724 RepID=A0ABV8EL82_9BACT|nr:cbb3-type cytochrome c oxidase subunit 3 [Belliella kenyensis]MCH7400669.1 cbb3-type cytochrome c oxidase subunit 3 [Belliella kenyensis]MDN3602044.1 cbb3-type cytochrome c oxidase subunit 3 [Belliella kenyensis]